MKLLPVAERELRVASRRRGTYWVRFGGAALGIVAACLMLLSTTRLRPVDQSQILFVTLSILAFVYCLLSGLLTTSDCVSEERRDGTLGLLFLTNLRGFDVVVGKVVASSARSVLAVVALMPVIALPVLMGGVSGRVLGAVALVLGNTLFLSLVIGVLVSVSTRDARHSIGGSVAVLAVWVGLLPLLRVLWIEYGLRPRFQGAPAELMESMRWVLEINPVYVFSKVLEALFRGTMTWSEVWRGLIAQHVMGWGMLVAACWILPRSWRDRVETARNVAAGSGGPAQEVRAVARRRWRGELLDWHPFVWMVAKDRRAGLHVWLGLAVVAGVWVWGFWEVKDEWLAGLVGLWTTFAAGLWLKLRVAALACRHLHEHRRSGALELVLSTPVTPESMVKGHLQGIRHVVFPPLAAVVAAAGLLLVASFGQEQSWSERTEVPVSFAVLLGVLILDLVVLSWGGMWWGLKSSRYIRAYSMTVGSVLLLPWLIFVVSLLMYGVMVEVFNLGGGGDFGYLTMLGWWTAISVGVDLWQWTLARRGLGVRFRDLAAEPYGTLREPAPGVAAGKPL